MKIMKICLFTVSVLLFICVASMILRTKGSAQELESLIVSLIASVLFVGACIIHAIDLHRKTIEDKCKLDSQ